MAQPGNDAFEDDDDGEFKPVVDSADAQDGEGPAGDASAHDEEIEVVVAGGTDAGDAVDGPDESGATDDDAISAGGEDDEPAAGEEDAEGDDELDDEARSYGKNVQARIRREIRLRKRAAEEGQRAVITERQQRLDTHRELLQTRKHLAETLLVNVDGDIDKAKAELKRAKDDGNTDEEVAAQEKLSQLHARKAQLEDAKKSLEATEAQFEQEAKRQTAAASASQELTPATRSWVERNKWMKNPKLKSEAYHVLHLDSQLTASGKVEPGTPAYFKELDRLIARELPALKTKIQATMRQQPAGKNNAARAGAAPGGRSAPGQSRSASGPTKVVITNEDKQKMLRFKMDPTNKEHLLEFARNKRLRQLRERSPRA
jgi:hypothetical protein